MGAAVTRWSASLTATIQMVADAFKQVEQRQIDGWEAAVLDRQTERRTFRRLSQDEIAAALGISPATVKRHLENILRKLHLKNRVAAAIYELRSAGCPHGFDLACPLIKNGQEEINIADEKWAV